MKKIRQLIKGTYFGTSKVGASLPSLTVRRNFDDADSEGQHNVSKGAACLERREDQGTSQQTMAVDNLQRLVDETLELSKP